MACCRESMIIAQLHERGLKDEARALHRILADKWKSLPKGWTKESAEKFWNSLTGDHKHKISDCMKKMKGKVTDPGAFCGGLASRLGKR